MAANDSTLQKKSTYDREKYLRQKAQLTEEQKEQKRAYVRAWHHTNKERLKVERAEYNKAYNAANRHKQKAWRDANREKLKAYMVEYHSANKQKHLATMRANYEANAEAYKARAVEWKKKNPERFKEIRVRNYAKNLQKNRQIGREDWRKHNAKRKAAKAVYRALHPEIGAHFCRLRQTRKQQATPAWADLTEIKAKYAEAARLRRETGIEWHVDHEIPLKHPFVSGLHVHTNLRVIPGSENQSKGNGFTV